MQRKLCVGFVTAQNIKEEAKSMEDNMKASPNVLLSVEKALCVFDFSLGVIVECLPPWSDDGCVSPRRHHPRTKPAIWDNALWLVWIFPYIMCSTPLQLWNVLKLFHFDEKTSNVSRKSSFGFCGCGSKNAFASRRQFMRLPFCGFEKESFNYVRLRNFVCHCWDVDRQDDIMSSWMEGRKPQNNFLFYRWCVHNQIIAIAITGRNIPEVHVSTELNFHPSIIYLVVESRIMLERSQAL